MQGAGVRFGRDRGEAFEVESGETKGALSLDRALQMSGLDKAPAPRSAGTLPAPTGFDTLRHQKTKAWYQYRALTEQGLTESNLGANEFEPVWKQV
mmetsp:Transcript_148725/g.477610  ORF Transcript_148725/g.477610 Transcript_148725/m.477610 type:complete len:96 (+) Transcript_148725:214-501(+)